jgi:pimeloyl-ACP methyl ester carboxylesterase
MGKTVVAMHGAGMNAGIWGTLDLPGHGKNGEALLPSIEKMAAWVEKQLGRHAPESVVLMGHSMGALVALEAAKNPAVGAVVLLGAAAKMPVHPDLLRQAAENPAAAADMILKWGVFSGHPEADALKSSLKKQMQPETLLNDMKACDSYSGGAAAAKKINKPVLVIAGEHDKMTRPQDGKTLADMIKGAAFHLLSGAGHMVMVEKPSELAKEIKGFSGLDPG